MTVPFVVWMTGPPGSGKSTVTGALIAALRKRDVDPVVLEFDVFRKHFMPRAPQLEEERILFYRGIVEVAAMMVERGLSVVIDATGNRRDYRAPARERFPKFAEVYIDCPPEVCIGRAAAGPPRLPAEYEPPLRPEVHIRSDREDPDEGARKVVSFLVSTGWIPAHRAYRV